MDKEKLIRDWALSQVGSPYVYGATGVPCTPALRQARSMQYPLQAALIHAGCPVLSGKRPGCTGCIHQGRLCFDCAQFVKKACEQAGIRLPSGASSQWKAGPWAKKGTINEEARTSLCLVFARSDDISLPMRHVGLSLGDGRVVDARSHVRGVVIGNFSDYRWTHYATLKLNQSAASALPALGETGDAVKALQTLLMQKGYALPRFGADGQFGQETLQALNLAQESLGFIKSDQAQEKLLAALKEAPAASAPPVPQAPRINYPGTLETLYERMEEMEEMVSCIKLQIERSFG